MDTILLFQALDSYASRLRLEGLSGFAREVGWNVQCYGDQLNEESLTDLRDFWRPIGSILSTNDGRNEYDASLFSPDKTVLLDCFPTRRAELFASVVTDSFATAEIAARELLGCHCASYAYVPWPIRRVWSENRRQQFTRVLARQGLSPFEFAASRGDLTVRELQQELVPWLRSLPKPCGIFAVNDRAAMNVLHACLQARLNVPFDCAVVSVDDNKEVCENTNPTLTSVGLDFRRSGYEAGKLLYRLLHGQLKDERPIVSLPPLGLTRRNSSRQFLKTDRAALLASEMIRAKACEGLQARDVLDTFPCSRRLAEIRFRTATGHSVLDEIRSVRIEHAKQLLKNRFVRLDAIAERCGYASDTTFRRIFKEETGKTLRQWQQAYFLSAAAGDDADRAD